MPNFNIENAGQFLAEVAQEKPNTELLASM